MTTWNATRTTGYRVNLEDVKNVWYAFVSWVANARANYRNARLERWNSERRAMLESRGMSSYK